MDSRPATTLTLVADSAAQDLSYVGLADLARALDSSGKSAGARLIGGHMMNLHCERWGLGLPRVTMDTDLGAFKLAYIDNSLVSILEELGYERFRSNRWRRVVPDVEAGLEQLAVEERFAIIDLLLAPTASRARKNVAVGRLKTIEVPGLAEALREPGVELTLGMTRLNGVKLGATMTIPSEPRALTLKALAWDRRQAAKDAVDIWRGLKVCFAAEAGPECFQSDSDRQALAAIRCAFGDLEGLGMTALRTEEGLSETSSKKRHTEIRGLALEVLDLAL